MSIKKTSEQPAGYSHRNVSVFLRSLTATPRRNASAGFRTVQVATGADLSIGYRPRGLDPSVASVAGKKKNKLRQMRMSTTSCIRTTFTRPGPNWAGRGIEIGEKSQPCSHPQLNVWSQLTTGTSVGGLDSALAPVTVNKSFSWPAANQWPHQLQLTRPPDKSS